MKIHAALMTQNELLDLVANVTRLLQVCDDVTIVDGGSNDGTIPYFRNWCRVEPRIRYFIHPWEDNFPKQRNNYLARVAEIAQPGDYVWSCDLDEFLIPDVSVGDWRREMERWAASGVGTVLVRCRSVSLLGPGRCWENLDDYYKSLFMRWMPRLSYGHDGEGPVHETINGRAPREIRSAPPFVYEHQKQENVIWPRGARNYFCGGGGMNAGSKNARWVEPKTITRGLGIETWAQMHALLLRGNLPAALKEWIFRGRHETGWDGASEAREWYKTAFRLYHPEEEPAEMRGENIE